MLWHQFISKIIYCIISQDPIYCSLNEDYLVYYLTDALLRVPVMWPSSNTPLLVKTIKVRHRCQHLSYQKFSPYRNYSVKDNGPSWASSVDPNDYELICPRKAPVPVTEFKSCHLAVVPAHAVVTRPESRGEVVRILLDQQVSRHFFHHFYLFTICNLYSSTELQV